MARHAHLITGDWLRSPLAPAGTPAPHPDPSRPGAQIAVEVVWADQARTVAIAVQDVCGCQALVVRVDPADEEVCRPPDP